MENLLDMLILCFAVLLAAVTADSSHVCCLPKRFQISHYMNRVSSDDTSQLVSVGCNSSADYELGMLSTSCMQFSPAPDAYMLIQDYKHGKSYFVLAGSCNVMPLKTKFMQCFPGTEEVSNLYFGSKETGSFPIKTYSMELNGKMTYVSLSEAALDKGECNLVSTMSVNQGGMMLETIGYFNYTAGVKDTSVFDIPTFCNNSNQDTSNKEKIRKHIVYLPHL